jgi:hypothetical protein
MEGLVAKLVITSLLMGKRRNDSQPAIFSYLCIALLIINMGSCIKTKIIIVDLLWLIIIKSTRGRDRVSVY